MIDLNELNEEQRQALECSNGAVLVTAGAGSGKTRLLTHRIVYLIQEKNVAPYNILAITFTNKATKEMKERIASMLGFEGGVWISTIHSMCATILRNFIQKLDARYTSNFSIYSPDECQKEVKRILENKNLSKNDKEGMVKTILFHIGNYKNENIDLQEYKKIIAGEKNADIIIDCIYEYNYALRESNAVDFDDLLVLTEQLLRKDSEVLDFYASRFKYIHVDEFQDTNVVQYNIVKLLASKYGNVFVVGDEDQCIYGWRGASIANISNFIKDFSDCHVFKLERNYRSTKKILDLANKLISHNSKRITKNLYTENNDGENIVYKTLGSDRGETEFVAQKICELKTLGYEYKDIAVLMRLNALSRGFEQKFLNYNIPYVVYGGFKFFDRLEIKNVLAYLRLVNNPSDNASFMRVINFPKRGLGDASITKLREFAEDRQMSLFTICGVIQECDTLNNGTKKKFEEFYNLIQNIKEFSKQNDIPSLINFVVKNVAILDAFEDTKEDRMNRELNINSLIQSADEFVKSNEDTSLNKYLESVSLISDLDTAEDVNNAVTLATVHAVKGLEFKVVFIVGVEQQIFPIVRYDTDEEEERRLMYVAITRAENLLFLTNTQNRYLYNKADFMTPSIFLKEMGLDSVISYKEQKERSFYDDESTQMTRTNKSLVELNQFDYKLKKSNNGFNGFVEGAKVSHNKFGDGVILQISGSGINTEALIKFESVGVKNLMLQYANLKLI